VMKKTQDVAESQAESLLQLIMTATPDGVGTNLNVYA
jgi:Putative motility protein